MADLEALKALHMHLASATAISHWLSQQAGLSPDALTPRTGLPDTMSPPFTPPVLDDRHRTGPAHRIGFDENEHQRIRLPPPLGAINHRPPDVGLGRRLMGSDQPGTRLRYDDPTDDRYPRGAPRDNYSPPDRHIYAPPNGDLARHNSLSSRLPPHPRSVAPHDPPHRGREDKGHPHDYHDSYERRDRQAAYDSRDEHHFPPQKHPQPPLPHNQTNSRAHPPSTSSRYEYGVPSPRSETRDTRGARLTRSASPPPPRIDRSSGPHARRASPSGRYPERGPPPPPTLESQPVALQAMRTRKQPGAILVNSAGQRICRECGQIGRYRDGRCIEKWGPGPEGPGTVCDRCRKRMKRLQIRSIPNESGQQPSPPNEISLVPPTTGSPKVPLLRRISPLVSDDMEADQDDEEDEQERSYSPHNMKEAPYGSSSKRRPLLIWGQDSTRTHIPSRGSQPLPPSLRPVPATSRSCSPDELSD